MKKYYFICPLMILLSLVFSTASSQNKLPRQDAYWVIMLNEVNTVWLADKLKRDSIFVANRFKK